ncbi:MAG TPA: VWA domain-containing protein, partial [Anaerolineae bacterium]|nr:VWA domain-containing protein [Anaerolineae bacterium]
MKAMWTILLLVLLIGHTMPVLAQGPVNLSIDGVQYDASSQARAYVTVRNENGVPIMGLQAAQFEIVEDGKTSFPPAQVEAQSNPEATISIVMVIDISGSMKGKPIKEAMRAANALIDQMSPQDRGAIIAFADQVNLDPNVLAAGKEIGFTTDKNALHNVVNFLETRIGWDTPLYDAIYKGVKMAAGEPVGKRAVIVMTDGRDERDNAQGVPIKDAGSLSTPDDPINEANRHNIPIFSIGLVGMGGKIDTKYLQRLAERTGGVYQKAPKPEELAPLFQNVVNQLKHQYILTYDSTLPNDSAYHSLLIRVQLPQGQGFDEIKFQINPEAPPPPTEAAPPPASSPPPPAQTGGPSITPGPTPSVPTPTPTDFIGAIKTTVEENPWLLVLVSGVVVLLFLIIALLLLLFRGQKEEEEP